MAKSALRVLQIMEYVAAQRDGFSHTDLAKALEIPKSSLTGLLRDLVSTGYLHKNQETGVFTIGVQVLTLANAYLRGVNIVRLGQPIIGSLFSQINEYSMLCIASELEYVIVCAESVPTPVAHSLQIGHRGPLFCSAVGKAMLAYMPPDQSDAILRKSDRKAITPYTRTDIKSIKADLDEIRKKGIAYSHQENFIGVTGVAAPVLNASGVPVASIGVALPTGAFESRRMKKIETQVKHAAKIFSEQLGWRP
jgi:DNA-binding IclR family transcriptional regulator